jgi:hypothetical protein
MLGAVESIFGKGKDLADGPCVRNFEWTRTDDNRVKLCPESRKLRSHRLELELVPGLGKIIAKDHKSEQERLKNLKSFNSK